MVYFFLNQVSFRPSSLHTFVRAFRVRVCMYLSYIICLFRVIHMREALQRGCTIVVNSKSNNYNFQIYCRRLSFPRLPLGSLGNYPL